MKKSQYLVDLRFKTQRVSIHQEVEAQGKVMSCKRVIRLGNKIKHIKIRTKSILKLLSIDLTTKDTTLLQLQETGL